MPNAIDQFHVMHKMLGVMNTLMDEYGKDVFIKARDVDINVSRYMPEFIDFSDKSFTMITLLRNIAYFSVHSLDIEKSKDYIKDLFTGLDHILKPSERGVFAPKLASLFDTQMRTYQKDDTAYLALISPVMAKQEAPGGGPSVKFYNFAAETDEAIAFFEKAKAHINSLPQYIPQAFDEAIYPLLTFDDVPISDMLLEASEKLKVGSIKEVLEKECASKGVDGVRESLVEMLSEGFSQKIEESRKKRNNGGNKNTHPYIATYFNTNTNQYPKIVANVGIALAEFDRINPSSKSVAEAYIDRFDMMVKSGDEVATFKAGIGLKILIDAISAEEKRFLKVKGYQPWVIDLESRFNYFRPLNDSGSSANPILPQALINQHAERACMLESNKNGREVNGDEIRNSLNENTL